MGEGRPVLLIGGTKNGKIIHIKTGHTFITNAVKPSFEEDHYYEQYEQFGLLDSVFVLSDMDTRKATNIIQELIMQGLQNGR